MHLQQFLANDGKHILLESRHIVELVDVEKNHAVNVLFHIGKVLRNLIFLFRDDRLFALFVLLLDAFVYAYKPLVALVLAFQNTVAPVDFPYFLHHLVHILYALFRISRILWHKALFAEILAKLVGKNHIFVLLCVEVRLKLSLHTLATLTYVVDNDAHFLWHSFLEFKFEFGKRNVNDARHVSLMLRIFKKINAFDAMCYLCDKRRNGADR